MKTHTPSTQSSATPFFEPDQLAKLLDQLSEATLICDEAQAILYANSAARVLFGLPETYDHINLKQFLPIHLRSIKRCNAVCAGLASDRRKKNQHRIERCVSLIGTSLVVDLAISEVEYQGRGAHFIFCRQVSEEVERAFEEREDYQRLQTFVSFAPIGIFYLNAKLQCDYVNDHWCRMTGLNIDESMGSGWLNAFLKNDVKAYIQNLQTGTSSHGEHELECQIRTPLGKTRWVLIKSHVMQTAERRHLGIAGTIQDIDDLVTTQRSLQEMADKDYLTGLANRKLFISSLHQAILRVNRHHSLGLMFIDLNHFKEVNDRCGHNDGDEYLKICAERIRDSLREEDLVARLGGDEFTVLIEGIVEYQDLAAIAEKIISNVSAPLIIDNQTFIPGAAIGIAVCEHPHMETSTFIKQADEAMYQAKQEDGNGYRFFSARENAIASLRSAMSRNIGKALENNEFDLWYQKQYAVDSNQPIGCEALMRWRSPTLGNVSPRKFVPVLESSELIHSATHWLIEKAVHDLHDKQQSANDEGFAQDHMSINLSAKSIRDKNFTAYLREVLQEYPLAKQSLVCEITESVMLNDFERARQFIDQLKTLDLMVALDDFGTGYCSLQYLRKFPIDWIKIDASFIHGMVMQDEDRTIVKTIIDLARNLNMRIVAEGVETETQLRILKKLQCDYYQGFLTERPPEYSLGQADW